MPRFVLIFSLKKSSSRVSLLAVGFLETFKTMVFVSPEANIGIGIPVRLEIIIQCTTSGGPTIVERLLIEDDNFCKKFSSIRYKGEKICLQDTPMRLSLISSFTSKNKKIKKIVKFCFAIICALQKNYLTNSKNLGQKICQILRKFENLKKNLAFNFFKL